MTSTQRRQLIEERLTAALTPSSLNIEDNSSEHIGHPGHQGAGHFSVTIISDCFAKQSLIQRHRMVYQPLEDIIGPEIHALSIDAKTPEEAGL